MRNVTEKIDSLRTAMATASVTMSPETLTRLKNNDVPKPDVLPIARAAAIMAAKKTPDIIPYCHSVPLDHVGITFEFKPDGVAIEATATAVWKTGVEMEALLAANVAALTVYDMLKPIDDAKLSLGASALAKKTGGKSDFIEHLPATFKAAVIVTSDGTAAGKRQDKSGLIIKEKLESLGVAKPQYVVLPDERELIRNELLKLCEQGVDLVLTTGGTGLGPRDVTVEATRDVIERDMPAVMDAIRSYGQSRTPYAMLSRGLAGVRGNTVIVNFPGSSRGTSEGLNAVFPALLHVFKMMRGGGH